MSATLIILAAVAKWIAANKVFCGYVVMRDARFWSKVKGFRGLKNFWLTGSVSPDATPAKIETTKTTP